MPYEDAPSRIENTILGPETTPGDVIEVLDAAIEYGTGARVPPCYVPLADSYAPGVDLATVIGFPHGQDVPSVKAAGAERAQQDGADRLVTVPNVGRVLAGEEEGVSEDIAEVVAATALPVTVIVEGSLLTGAEQERLGQLAAEAGAESLETATGFNRGSATVEDVERLSRILLVTAAGDIDSWDRVKALFDAGADRISTGNAAAIVEEYRDAESRT